MMKQFVNVMTIIGLYLVSLAKHLLSEIHGWDIQFIMSTLLCGILIIFNTFSDKFSTEMKDAAKFLGHIFFISVCISLISNIIIFIYNILFYFGFVNTIVVINVIGMLFISGFVKMFRFQLFNILSKTFIGGWILKGLNYFYNIVVVLRICLSTIGSYAHFIFTNYLWVYTKFIYYKLVDVNSELCDNSQSHKIKIKINDKCSETKNYVIEQIVQPYFIRTLGNTLNNHALFIDPYKTVTDNSNLGMSVLSNTKMNLTDQIDDDLDTELDAPMIEPLVTETVDPVDPVDSVDQSIPVLDKKSALRKKLSEKKSKRTGRTAKQDMSNMMNMPGMGQLMETMMEGNNLEKIMKQIPPEKLGLGLQMPNVDPQQMKQFMQAMMKKS